MNMKLAATEESSVGDDGGGGGLGTDWVLLLYPSALHPPWKSGGLALQASTDSRIVTSDNETCIHDAPLGLHPRCRSATCISLSTALQGTGVYPSLARPPLPCRYRHFRFSNNRSNNRSINRSINGVNDLSCP